MGHLHHIHRREFERSLGLSFDVPGEKYRSIRPFGADHNRAVILGRPAMRTSARGGVQPKSAQRHGVMATDETHANVALRDHIQKTASTLAAEPSRADPDLAYTEVAKY